MKVPPELLSLITSAKSFFIATHINPEGDAIGSAAALAIALESIGKDIYLFDRDPVPEVYRFLPHSEGFTNIIPASTFDVMIIVDCGDIERIGSKAPESRHRAVIDHHITERPFGDIRWVTPHASATGEMIYSLLNSLGIKITRDIAVNLYTAIVTDTGFFRYANTTPDAMMTCGELIDLGVDPSEVNEAVSESFSLNKFKLLSRVLSTIQMDGKTAWLTVTNQMYEETGTSAADTENFVNYPLIIRGIAVSVLFRQLDPDLWKISLRSKRRLDVASIAEEFGGGGHKNAAGCNVKGDLHYVRDLVINSVKRAIHESNSKSQ